MKRLSIRELAPGMVLAQDVFTAEEKAAAFLRAGAALTQRNIEQLEHLRIGTVYIEDGRPTTKADLLLPKAKNLVVPAPPALPPQLRHQALVTLQDMFESANTLEGSGVLPKQMAAQMESVVDQILSTLYTQAGALVNINDLKSYDDYTYHHSLSVAVLSIGIAKQLGLSGEALRQVGLAAIMHDIGKTKVPIELIRKPARLSNEEFELVKYHSEAGWEYLTDSAILNESIWQGVLYHHEKMDGTGYPHGLAGNSIPVISRIIAVADVYDALTSNRPYRTPMAPGDALEYIMGGINSAFDYDIVSSLVSKVSPYPKGSIVQLSTGQYALVLEDENQLRPVVEVLGSGQILDLFNDRRTYNIVVQRLVPFEERA